MGAMRRLLGRRAGPGRRPLERPTPGRRAAFVFAAFLPIVSALALLPQEFTHYKRWLELGRDETALRLAVFVTILSKTLIALLVGIAALAVLAVFLKPRALRIVAFLVTLAFLGILCLDLELQRTTGNSLARYLPYLADPETFRWAGQGLAVGSGLIGVAGRLAIPLLAGAVLARMVEIWVARSIERRERVLLSGLLAVAGLVLVATPLLSRFAAAPAPLHHLRERLPWAWHVGSDSGFEEIGTRQREAQRLFDRIRPRLDRPRSFEGLPAGAGPSTRPDILLVVVESLRHDVLEAETMPRLRTASELGMRFDAHHATSNASHYGMFALLYGRSPLRYFETLDAGEPPTLPARLREWGYTTHHVTCSDIRWRRMDEFMGPPHFSVERLEEQRLDVCDRDVVSRSISLLEPGDRPPRFVLAFLMSTHFGYHFPNGAEPFQPSAPPPNAFELSPRRDSAPLWNRYRNSAHHVDALIGRLLDRVDLDQTWVVITGDHGESIFDDGTIAHSSRLSEIQTRVPLVILGPQAGDRSPHVRLRGPTDHSDLLPTLFARLGIDAPRLEGFPGRDLLAGGESPFVALVQAKARRGGQDRVALVSTEARHAIRLDLDSGRLLVLGGLGADGRPTRDRGLAGTHAHAMRWLEAFLEGVARR